jgi:hypothetical protein
LPGGHHGRLKAADAANECVTSVGFGARPLALCEKGKPGATEFQEDTPHWGRIVRIEAIPSERVLDPQRFRSAAHAFAHQRGACPSPKTTAALLSVTLANVSGADRLADRAVW